MHSAPNPTSHSPAVYPWCDHLLMSAFPVRRSPTPPPPPRASLCPCQACSWRQMSRATALMEAAPSPLGPLRGRGGCDKTEVGIRPPHSWGRSGPRETLHSYWGESDSSFHLLGNAPQGNRGAYSFHGYASYVSCVSLCWGHRGEGNTLPPCTRKQIRVGGGVT